MHFSIPIPHVDNDNDKVNSNISRDNTLASNRTTSPSSSSNQLNSPFSSDPNKVANDNRSMLVCPTVMAVQNPSRLHMSRQGVMQPIQSQEGNQSPSTKRSRVEEKDDALQTLPSICAKVHAIPSNHDLPKNLTRNNSEDARTEPALSRENHDDTPYSINDSLTEQKEIPIVHAEGADCEFDLLYRNRPMKRPKVAFIRIPTSSETSQTQTEPTKQKPLTSMADTNHITENNTAIPKTGGNKNNLSVAVLNTSDPDDITNSSPTTESSSTSNLTTPSTNPASATSTPSLATSSKKMNDVGKVGENLSPILENESHLITAEISKNITIVSSKAILEHSAPSLTTTSPNTNTNTESSKGKVIEKPVDKKPENIVKESEEIKKKQEIADIKKKQEIPVMSIIKNNPQQEAVSSTSVPPLPPNQNKVTVDSSIKISKNPRPVSSTPTVSPSSKKEKKTKSSNKRKRSGSNGSASSSKSKGQTSGRWTQGEHQAFLEGLTECGREWKKVALRIPTRTSAQIRSHAQKYFAKLQRDQESSASNANVSMLHGDLSTPLMTGLDGSLVVSGEGGRLSGTVITSPSGSPLAPSVRRNVERIVANPRAAQREVEDTMEALRERYRQLQQRLEDRRRTRVEDILNRTQQQSQALSSASAHTQASSEVSAFASPPAFPQKQKQISYLSRKRMQLPTNHRNHDTKSSDDNSSVCSNVSSIAASRTDLGNEEIIALQVLGNSLPRSESVNDLHVLGAEVFADGTMPSINDNISSSSYDLLAPLPGVGNDNDSLMNNGASVTTNDNNTRNGDAATSGSLSVGGLSTI